ncbi:MAG TPA: hypothetical protein VHR84_07970 [Terriglobales bacterium]|nr:hypothetical protein [Terriglobales bacterium]
MSYRKFVDFEVRGWLPIALLVFGVIAQAQNMPTPEVGAQTPNQPAPAFGQETPPQQATENPPLSGLDEPVFEPGSDVKNYIQPGLAVSESLDTNAAGDFSNAKVRSVTRVLGSLAVQRIWSRFDAGLDYVGGAGIYTHGLGTRQVHSLDSFGRTFWRNGHLTLRNNFSYLPEGTFGFGSYGGVGGFPFGGAIGGGGVGGFGGALHFFGVGQLGTLGNEPHLTNLSTIDIAQHLTPRSSVTFTAGYGIGHFTDDTQNLVDSRQTAAQVGYNYVLSRKDQIGLIYGYQHFQFPGGGNTFNTHLGHIMYGRAITGRMSFVIAAGPQVTELRDPVFGNTNRLTGSGRASLHYRFPKTTFAFVYSRYNTTGSGFFAGAESDIIRFNVTRALGRKYEGFADVGYSRNKRLQDSFLGVNAAHFNSIYAGTGVHRQLTRELRLFLTYQFAEVSFDDALCAGDPSCSHSGQRHVVTVGLGWRPRPVRLD